MPYSRALLWAFASLALGLVACGGGGGGSDGGAPQGGASISVSLNVTALELPVQGTHAFGCTVTGTADRRCRWRVEGSGGGVVSDSGFYTAPDAPGSYRVVATAAADPSQSATVTVTVRARQSAVTPWVTGYYAGWYWNNDVIGMPPQSVDMTAMTHFVFGRIAPGGGSLGGVAGSVVPGGGNVHDIDASPFPGLSVEDWLVRRAHESGVKALVMLGGDGDDGLGFLASTAPALRPRFVQAVVDYMVAHNYDGVDVDWENQLETPQARAQLLALLGELRSAANARPRYRERPVIITFPGYALNTNFLEPGGRVQQWQADVANSVDQFNLMSYGIGTTWWEDGWRSWFSGPIFGARGDYPVDLDSSVRAYVATGVPRHRIGIGIGFFGIYYGPTVTGPRQSLAGNRIYETDDNALAYSELRRMGYLDAGAYRWDEEAQVGYRTYAPPGFVAEGRNPAGFLSFENEQSIAAKGRWVRESGLGGTIIWTINYGYQHDTRTNPLLEAVKQSFLN